MPKKNPNKNKRKNVIEILVKNKEIAKQLNLLKGVAEFGIKTAGKGIVIIYKRTSIIGEIAKDVLFLLIGVSILFAGIFASPSDVFSVVKLVATLERGLIGRIIVIIFGLSLFSYGIGKLAGVVREKFLKKGNQK